MYRHYAECLRLWYFFCRRTRESRVLGFSDISDSGTFFFLKILFVLFSEFHYRGRIRVFDWRACIVGVGFIIVI